MQSNLTNKNIQRIVLSSTDIFGEEHEKVMGRIPFCRTEGTQ